MDISVVIPTRDRQDSLQRLLSSLKNQSFRVHEIIVVDASQRRLQPTDLKETGLNGMIKYYHTSPSVTAQRNRGIREASSEYVFLCDDDMEIPRDYLSEITDYLKNNPERKVVTGIVAEKNQNGEFSDFHKITTGRLLWNTIFQLGVWTDMEQMFKNNRNPLVTLLKQYYKRRGNTLTLAGYPLVTQFNYPHFTTKLYGFGAAVVNRNWLLEHRYDEILDEYGIGDHYRLALQLPSSQPLTVLTSARVYHHKAGESRLEKHITYYRRIVALDYIFRTSDRFNLLNRIFLLWSLMGNWIAYVVKNERKMAYAAKKAFGIIITGKNPYVLSKKAGATGPINPTI